MVNRPKLLRLALTVSLLLYVLATASLAHAGSMAERSNGSASTVWVIVVFLIIVSAAIARAFKYMPIKARYNKVVNYKQSLLVRIYELEKTVAPLLQFSTGQSGAHAEQIKEKVYNLLQAVVTFSNQIDQFVIPIVGSLTETEAILNRCAHALRIFEQQFSDLDKEIERYKHNERQTKHALNQCKQAWEAADKLLHTHIRLTGHASTPLQGRMEMLKETIDQAERMLVFDPRGASDELAAIPAQVGQLENEIAMIGALTKAMTDMQSRLHETKAALDETIRTEQLILSEVHPYAIFDDAPRHMERLQRCLEVGDTQRASTILELLDRANKDALQQVAESIRARDWVEEELATASRLIAQFDDSEEEGLLRKLDWLKISYHQEHWRELSNRLEQLLSWRSEIKSELLVIAELNSTSVQRYLEAEQRMKVIAAQLEDMIDTSDQLNDLKYELDGRKSQLKHTADIIEGECTDIRRLVQHSSIAQREQLLNKLGEVTLAVADARRILDSRRPNLIVAEKELSSQEMLVKSLSAQVGGLIQGVRQWETAASQFYRDVQQCLQAYSHMDNYSMYQFSLGRLESDLRGAIQSNNFSKASEYMQKGTALMAKMRRDYGEQRQYY